VDALDDDEFGGLDGPDTRASVLVETPDGDRRGLASRELVHMRCKFVQVGSVRLVADRLGGALVVGQVVIGRYPHGPRGLGQSVCQRGFARADRAGDTDHRVGHSQGGVCQYRFGCVVPSELDRSVFHEAG
jgi:hypothetical protein